MKIIQQFAGFVFLLLLCSCGKEKLDLYDSFIVTSMTSGNEYEVDIVKKGSGSRELVFFVLDGKELMPIIEKEMGDYPFTASVTFVSIRYSSKNYRSRDFTFTERGNNTGKGQVFLDFLTKELDYALRGKNLYTKAASRGIIGHSLGGLFAAHAFSQENKFFDHYLIMSPALFWDDYVYFKTEGETRAANRASMAKVFLGVGESEDMGMNNVFDHFKTLLQKEYPSVRLATQITRGSHYYSRNENIKQGLIHLINP